MGPCEVCFKVTSSCPPSQFAPYSTWRCNECRAAKRLAYWELVGAYCGKENWDREFGESHLGKWVEPSLSFCKRTLSQLIKDSEYAKSLKAGDEWNEFMKQLKVIEGNNYDYK